MQKEAIPSTANTNGRKELSLKQIESIKLAVAIFGIILVLLLLGYTIKYREELNSNPCSLIGNRTDYRCVPNPEKFECACGLYTPTSSFKQAELNIADLEGLRQE